MRTEILQAKSNQIKINLIFKKTYFGKMNNLNTPDRQLNPDDDKFTDCLLCKGKGKIIVENTDSEDDEQSYDYETCTECDGEGFVPIKNW